MKKLLILIISLLLFILLNTSCTSQQIEPITEYKFTGVDTTCAYTGIYISRLEFTPFDSLIKTWMPVKNTKCRVYPIRIIGGAYIEKGKLVVTDSLRTIQQLMITLWNLNNTPEPKENTPTEEDTLSYQLVKASPSIRNFITYGSKKGKITKKLK